MNSRNDELCDERILLQLPSRLKLAVKKIAKADGRPTNNFIRFVLEAAVEERAA